MHLVLSHVQLREKQYNFDDAAAAAADDGGGGGGEEKQCL